MIAECQAWVEDALKGAGIPPDRISDNPAALELNQALPRAVRVLGREKLKRDGSRVARDDAADGKTRVFRRRRWFRTLPVDLYLFHKTTAEADQVLDEVLAAAVSGPVDAQGNRHRVRANEANWVVEKSATLQQVKVLLPLEFEGGVYRDERVPLVKDVAPEPEGN